jgi:polysaccharide pyruvyl transferase CsaB
MLAGYIGCGNLGDDAIMLGLVHALSAQGYDFTVMSGAPEETYRLYGLSGMPRRDMKRFEELMPEHDALVFPGGSIFQDATSMMSPGYYSKLVEVAKKAKKKVIMVGQGVGPLTSFLGKRASVSAFNSADAIAVRDPASMTLLKELGVKTPVRVAADMAFLMPQAEATTDDESFKVGNMRAIGIAPRSLPKGHDAAALFGEFCRLIFQSGIMPVLIPMDKNEDVPLIQEISNRQGGRIPDIRKVTMPSDLQNRMARLDAMVAVRLHAGILAANVGCPPLMIGYDPKVIAFARMMEIGNALQLEGLTAQRMFDAFTVFIKDRERNIRLLAKKREEMIRMAQLNVQLVVDTLGR